MFKHSFTSLSPSREKREGKQELNLSLAGKDRGKR